MAIKLTLEDGMTVEGSAEELAKFQRLTGVAEVTAEEQSSFRKISDANDDESNSEGKRLTVGDYAVVVESRYMRQPNGTIVEIVVDDESDVPYKAKHIGGGSAHWYKASDLKRLDDGGRDPQVGDKILVVKPEWTAGQYGKGDIRTVERIRNSAGNVDVVEHSEHNIHLERSEFVILPKGATEKEAEEQAVGDYVKVAGETRYGYITDTVTRVHRNVDSNGDVIIETLDKSDYDYAKPSALEKITDADELARVKAFEKAGRKYDEFKAGDVVRVTNTLWTSRVKVGQITEVHSHDGIGSPLVYVIGGGTRYAKVDLIAPASARVDEVDVE